MPTLPATSASLPTPPNAFDWRLDADGRVVLQKLRDASPPPSSFRRKSTKSPSSKYAANGLRFEPNRDEPRPF